MVGPVVGPTNSRARRCTLAAAHWPGRSMCTHLHNEDGVVHTRRGRRVCTAGLHSHGRLPSRSAVAPSACATWLPILAPDPAVDRGRTDQMGGLATRHETAACPLTSHGRPHGRADQASRSPTDQTDDHPSPDTRHKTVPCPPDQPWSASWSGRPRAPVACLAVSTLAAAQRPTLNVQAPAQRGRGPTQSARRRLCTARVRSRPGCTVGSHAVVFSVLARGRHGPWSGLWSGRPRMPVAYQAVCTLTDAQWFWCVMCRRLHNEGGVLHSRHARRLCTARMRSRPWLSRRRPLSADARPSWLVVGAVVGSTMGFVTCSSSWSGLCGWWSGRGWRISSRSATTDS